MASRLAQQEQELTCPVCRDIFRHPVMLPCSHSVCAACLLPWWTARPTKECPVCSDTRSALLHDPPPVNLALKNLCESFLGERGGHHGRCALHGEKLWLFCLEDEQLACLVCRDSERHTGHTLRPVDETARRLREQLPVSAEHIRSKLEDWVGYHKDDYLLAGEHVKKQARHTETQMRREFKAMRHFLHQEEEARVSALREEERQKSEAVAQMVEALDGEMAALSDAIRDVEADDVSFMQNYKAIVERVKDIPDLPDPLPLPEGTYLDVAKHLGNLTFNVWAKMKDAMVSYAPVVLDPNTAGGGFHDDVVVVSDDLTSARHAIDQAYIPVTPERFDGYAVMASEGFESGSHSWDVEVGDHTWWRLGVLQKPLHREDRFDDGFIPGRHWRLDHCHGIYRADYTSNCPESDTEVGASSSGELSVNQKPRRIRVHLDWERGQLSFSDPDVNNNNAGLLHTFTHTFTERVFPYIECLDRHEGAPLKLLTRKVCVSLEDHS